MRGCASSPSVSSPAGCACDSYPCTSAQPDPSAQGEIGGASICEHYRASPAIPGGPARVLQAPEFVWSSGSGSFPGARAVRHLAVFRWRKRPPAPPAGPATAAFAWFARTSHKSFHRSARQVDSGAARGSFGRFSQVVDNLLIGVRYFVSSFSQTILLHRFTKRCPTYLHNVHTYLPLQTPNNSTHFLHCTAQTNQSPALHQAPQKTLLTEAARRGE